MKLDSYKASEHFMSGLQCIAMLHSSIGNEVGHNFLDSMDLATKLIFDRLKRGGKLIWCGVGKNVYIARKMSATSQSLNLPSITLDVTKALHGDLGLIRENDVIIALSKSGTTGELVQLMEYVRIKKEFFKNVSIIGVYVDNPDKQIIQDWSDISVKIPNIKELDNWDKVPTMSVLVMQSVCDSIIMSVTPDFHEETGGFTLDKFTTTHPGGSIGGKN